MKCFALLAALSALASVSVSAEKCVLANLVKDLEPITKMVYACYDATGYAVIPPRANPTPEQTAAVCAKCPEMIATAKTMKFATCTFAVSGVDIPLNEWVPKITGACDASASASAGAGAGAASTNATASATSSNSTAAAGATTSNSTAGASGAAKSTVTAPAATTAAAATPAPTTSAANAVTSLSVAAVAVGSVAASFML